MRSSIRRICSFLVGSALLAAFAGGAAGESRNRALERVVAKGTFSAEDGTRIQRAFAAALHAGVREGDALAIIEVCVGGEFDASQAVRVLSLASQLTLERLPIDGFRSKLEEGVSKRVSTDRVIQTAERRALMLNKARQILNSLVLQGVEVEGREELLPDLAEALEAGQSPETARSIIQDALQAGERLGAIRRKLFP